MTANGLMLGEGWALKNKCSIMDYKFQINDNMSKENETKPLKQPAVKRCYYNDDWCKGKVIAVNTFHKYLCERCAKEYDSIKDEVVDHDFSIGDR